MARLAILDSAKRDVADIAAYIEGESGSRITADTFVDKLLANCLRLAALPLAVGRARPEIAPDYRSMIFGSYVVFFRYLYDENGERIMLQVVHVLHGARDLEAYFAGKDSGD